MAASIIGLVATAVVVWAVLSSVAGYPRYSPVRHFISQLAHPYNPYAQRVNNAFIAGGAMLTVALALLSITTQLRSGVWAARLGVGAAASLSLVGVFDLTVPLPHFAFAVATGALSLAACLLYARAAKHVSRTRASEHRRHGGATLVLTLVWLQLASIAAMLIYLVVVVVRASPGSLDQLLRLPPSTVLIRVGGTMVNPFAVAEWVLFSVVTLLFVAATSHELRKRYAA